MSFSDEVLIAYADGALAEPVRSEVARAALADPQVAARLARHQALRAKVRGASGRVSNEPAAPLLRSVGGLRPPAVANIIDLAAERASRQPLPTLPSQMMPPTPPRVPQRWHRWAGFAVALALGGVLGAGALLASNDTITLAQVGGVDGALVAAGALDTALSKQLAHLSQDGAVRMGVSFVAKDGNYCRSFQLDRAAGLACRNARRWQLAVLVQTPQRAPGTARLAFRNTPDVVVNAIDERIAGAALDARGEQIALRLGWQR
jgi:anti-sigma factor RsiW